MSSSLPDRSVRAALDDHFARIGAALSNPTRLRLLSLLVHGEKPVEALAELTGHSVASVSAHLKVLREAHLVVGQRDGRRVRYRLTSDEVIRLCNTLRQVAEQTLPEVREIARTYYEDPDTLTPVDADTLLEGVRTGELVLVDLRPADEYAAGHLPGARSVPFDELEQHLDTLPADRRVVAYCRGAWCVRAVRGVDALRRSGRRVTRLAFGVGEWRLAGHPLESQEVHR